jgi:hypothetical protein
MERRDDRAGTRALPSLRGRSDARRRRASGRSRFASPSCDHRRCRATASLHVEHVHEKSSPQRGQVMLAVALADPRTAALKEAAEALMDAGRSAVVAPVVRAGRLARCRRLTRCLDRRPRDGVRMGRDGRETACRTMEASGWSMNSLLFRPFGSFREESCRLLRGLSRRRSRVRILAPVKYLQSRIFCCRFRRKRPPPFVIPRTTPHDAGRSR